jgi:hypothetical protein
MCALFRCGSFVGVIFAALFAARAVASRADPNVIEGAKKEGEVVWYTTTALETSKKLADEFQKKYPFVRPANRPPIRNDVEADPPRLIKGYQRVTMFPDTYRDLEATQKIYNEIFQIR